MGARDLEDYIEADPMLLGERLLIIGRQVPTGHGGFVDLLAVDADGVVHVVVLERTCWFSPEATSASSTWPPRSP